MLADIQKSLQMSTIRSMSNFPDGSLTLLRQQGRGALDERSLAGFAMIAIDGPAAVVEARLNFRELSGSLRT